LELALSCDDEAVLRRLREHGWELRDALALTRSLDDYRSFIACSHAEFTVAKDQNIRLRSGWFSDRSACYLACGRPVITQDTGFGDVLPTGEGLFAFATVEDVLAAMDEIDSDYERQRRAAREIAQEHFAAERVLGDLLARCGLW
jgi:glycosyltransferase involved in cell wall biosynthesis